MAKSVAASGDLIPDAVATGCADVTGTGGKTMPIAAPSDGELSGSTPPLGAADADAEAESDAVAEGCAAGHAELELELELEPPDAFVPLGFGVGGVDACVAGAVAVAVADACGGDGVAGARRLTVPVASDRLRLSAIVVVTALGSSRFPCAIPCVAPPVSINTAKVPAPQAGDQQNQSTMRRSLRTCVHQPFVEGATFRPVTTPGTLLSVAMNSPPRVPTTEPESVMLC